ncbi:hypothetical protein PbB2_02642 [Candidatus Phycosocius bacilliformis]|uniref:TonB-dependent receptor-like beta-barrel domain-containing protein n=1 Tax=Candidatus Phycosocius bacilliformis TaxID=1445552 RepID=A0A2P2ED36_9PROT|nr:hypothetical protein PbB2_02642 [Candidatus Phycosocius bacilliformis]
MGVLRGYLANADRVRTQGVEADLAADITDRLSVYTNVAYTDATYRRFRDAPCPPELSGGAALTPGQTPGAAGVPGAISPANCDISGQVLPGVSKWALSFGGEYAWPARQIGKDGDFYVGLDGNYRSRFSSNPSPSAYTWIDGYSLLNV